MRRALLQRRTGLFKLFPWCALLVFAWPIGTAGAEPLALEVARAVAGFDQWTKDPVVTITLTESSKQKFAVYTSTNVGKATEVRVDGRTLMKPVIREPIMGGVIQISGHFTVEETRDIAARLSAGTARVEVEVVEN